MKTLSSLGLRGLQHSSAGPDGEGVLMMNAKKNFLKQGSPGVANYPHSVDGHRVPGNIFFVGRDGKKS
jgi:hypothetical protein